MANEFFATAKQEVLGDRTPENLEPILQLIKAKRNIEGLNFTPEELAEVEKATAILRANRVWTQMSALINEWLEAEPSLENDQHLGPAIAARFTWMREAFQGITNMAQTATIDAKEFRLDFTEADWVELTNQPLPRFGMGGRRTLAARSLAPEA
jgi:hypothetical protein